MLCLTETQKESIEVLRQMQERGERVTLSGWARAHVPPITRNALRFRVKWLLNKGALCTDKQTGDFDLSGAFYDEMAIHFVFLRIYEHLKRVGRAKPGFWAEAYTHLGHHYKDAEVLRVSYYQWAKRRDGELAN